MVGSLAEYTKKVEIGDIYKDLGLGKSISAKKVTVYVDGVENASQPARDITKGNDKNKYGDNGVLTEVFYNDDNDSVIITEVNTYIGSINKTVKATDKKDAYVVVTAEGPVVANFKNEFETDDKFEVDDYVLYTYSLKEKEIESVAAATKVEGTVTVAENSDTNNNDKKALTIDGTRYKASAQIGGQNLSDVSVKQDYTIYVDAYGYMIYVEEVEEIGNYALILNIKGGTDWYLGNRVELLFTDGTTKIVTTDKDYNAKKDMVPTQIVTYKVNDDGEYTLKALPTAKTKSSENDTSFKMDNNKAGIVTAQGPFYANSASVFVVSDTADYKATATSFTLRDGTPVSKNCYDIDDFTAYTGIKNAPSVKVGTTGTNDNVDAYWYCKSNSMVTVMFIMPQANAEVEDNTSKGLITRLTAYNDYDGTDKEGFLQGVDIDKTSKEYTVTLNTAGKLTLKNGTTDTTNHKNEIVTVDKDAKSFYVNTDDEISVFSYNAIAKDENDVVYAVIKDYMVKTLVIYEKDGNTDPVTPPLSDDIEVKNVDIDTPNTTIKFYVESGKATTLTTSDIKAILADKGCKDITKNGATWSFTYDGMTFAGVTVTQEQVYKVTFKVGPTAAGYTNKIVSGSSAYMSATGSKTATVVMSGSGWTGVTPTVVADPVAGGTFTIVAADTTTLTVTATAISKDVTVTIDF